MPSVYILKLVKGKYYVGKSDNLDFRLESHFNSNGSAWTKKYKPVKLEKLIKGADNFDEDKWTKKYMALYGIENVRGGSYCNLHLDDNQKDIISRELSTSSDSCFRCGSKEHFISNCDYLSSDDEEVWEDAWACEICNKEFSTENAAIQHVRTCLKYTDKMCDRCGRSSHTAEDCYAKRDVFGRSI